MIFLIWKAYILQDYKYFTCNIKMDAFILHIFLINKYKLLQFPMKYPTKIKITNILLNKY